MARERGGDRRGGMRPQCQKVLGKDIKPEIQHKVEARCKMPLQADHTCPVHGRDIK